ncbi:hypothetical protein QO951_004328 [Salmonella enterica]|nr:hypothetical protein [Salmonella enterica]EFA3283561.1 hypothetical protein [Salmonella enterica]EIY5380646.1 hypothetical protein [Salmonella enterica]ELS7530259.1 hypothetical protein [Salmonella enterica]
MEKLTHTQLLNRLAQFSGAHYEAAAIEDHDFARECADMVSVITEVLEARGNQAASGATFIDIPMMARTCVTTTAISILTAAHKSGALALLATTEAQGQWLMKERGLTHHSIVRLGDLDRLRRARVIVVDDAQYMEAQFAKIYPNAAGGLRAHLAQLTGVRVYWLTSKD